MCKKVDRTKSYNNGFGVHWRIKGRRSCETTICGGTSNVDKHKEGKHHWGGSITIHRNVSVDRNTTKGDGDWDAWIKCHNKKKTCNHG